MSHRFLGGINKAIYEIRKKSNFFLPNWNGKKSKDVDDNEYLDFKGGLISPGMDY